MAVIWGIPYLLIKIAVGELTPVTLVFLRTALGAALLLPIAAARGGLRRIGGLVIGLIGVAALVGLNVSFRDLGAVGEVGLVAVGYAAGPIIVARRLPHLPAIGVVAASLVVTAVAYAPLALRQLPSA